MKKIENFFFLKKTQILKSLWSMGLTHKISAKSETIFFFFSKGGPFGVFAIFEVSLCIHSLTLTDRNRGSDSLDYWNSGIKRCLNKKKQDWKDFQSSRLCICWQYLLNSVEFCSFYNVFKDSGKFCRILQEDITIFEF